MSESENVTKPGWERLREFTQARIALGRAGTGLPTAAHLQFQLAHAQARDAVYSALDTALLQKALTNRGWSPLFLHSAALDRREYLLRPDKGRQLNEASQRLLDESEKKWDVVFVLADGLSATAVERHALPLLEQILPALEAEQWRIAPPIIVEQGRVAVGDAIAALLQAQSVVVCIGERPGLSAADSLGIYLTYRPVPGVTTDAERNCLSNIRPEGLSFASAAAKLYYLLTESRRRQISGVALKEEAGYETPSIPYSSTCEK